MPSSMHEAFIEIFRHRPSLAAELLAGPLGVDVLPHKQARLEPADITDLMPPQYRADAELTVMSAMAHAGHPDRDRIWRALLAALASVDHERSTLYSDIVLAALPTAARQDLEALMATRTYEYQSDFVRRNVFQGRAEGKAAAIMTVLEARSVEVPDEARFRIMGCSDQNLLDVWIRRAVTATSIKDLFDA
jgi:hypothetical protein